MFDNCLDSSTPKKNSSPGGLTVGPARVEEVDEIARTWREAWHDGHRDRVPSALVGARDADYFSRRARELVEFTTVARESNVVVGLVIVVGDEIQQLMVDSSARGRGIACLLLQEAECAAASAGTHEMWLAVVPENRAARRLYESQGWVDCGCETYLSPTSAVRTVPVSVHRYTKIIAAEPQ